MSSHYEKYKRHMSLEEETVLYNRMRSGDPFAREELVLAHAYIATEAAKPYLKFADQEDLEQEAMMAIIAGADKYDINKGRLRTYVRSKVKTQLLRFLDKTKHPIRLPEPHSNAMLTLRTIRNKLELEIGKEPTIDDLMNNSEVITAYEKYKKKQFKNTTLREFVSLVNFGITPSSLDDLVSDKEDETRRLADVIPDPESGNEYTKVEYKDVSDTLMKVLDEDEKFILRSMADGFVGREIGKQFGLTTQAIFHRKTKAIEKIKQHINENPELRHTIRVMGFLEEQENEKL